MGIHKRGITNCLQNPVQFKLCSEHICVETGTPCPCRKDEYQCRDGSCILHMFICDGREDCQDGRDESRCIVETVDASTVSMTTILGIVLGCIFLLSIIALAVLFFVLRRSRRRDQSNSGNEPLKLDSNYSEVTPHHMCIHHDICPLLPNKDHTTLSKPNKDTVHPLPIKDGTNMLISKPENNTNKESAKPCKPNTDSIKQSANPLMPYKDNVYPTTPKTIRCPPLHDQDHHFIKNGTTTKIIRGSMLFFQPLEQRNNNYNMLSSLDIDFGQELLCTSTPKQGKRGGQLRPLSMPDASPIKDTSKGDLSKALNLSMFASIT